MLKIKEQVFANESQKHYIQNAIVLFFSLLILIMSFFSGAILNVRLDGGLAIPVKHNYLQVVEGALSIWEFDDGKILNYLDTFQGYKEIAEAQQKVYESVGDSNTIGIYDKIGQYISRHPHENFIKLSILQGKVYLNDSGDLYGMFGEIYWKYGASAATWSSAMQFCAMIVCLVNVIKSVIALIGHKQIKNLMKTVMLPFTFLIIKYAMLTLNTILKIDTIGIVTIVIYVLFIVLLCAHKFIFESSINKNNILLFAKNMTLMILGLVACFTAYGALISFKIEKNYTYSFTAGELINIYTLEMMGSLKGGNDVSESILLNMCAFLAYIPLVICITTVGHSAIRNLYEKLDSPESKYGNKLIARVITSLVFVIIIVTGISLFGNSLYNYGAISYKPIVSANIIVSLIACIALIVVNFAWEIKPILNQSVESDSN